MDGLVHAELIGHADASSGSGVSGRRRGVRRAGALGLAKARLYVRPVADDVSGSIVPGGTIVLLDEDENPYRLLRRTRHHPPILAACLVASGWCAPFTMDDEANARPPSSHPLRQRVRLSVAVTEAGIASVLRESDEPDVVHTLPSRGIGDLPDVLDAWWRGE